MFYNYEVLTSRKYGVATIWLVATLGSKSSAKKVNKKAILDVNVKKAVETILEPEAPMALRLQSNLLYGVSRVYDQQCGYVLHDAQAAHNNMRALLKFIRTNDLDPKAGKARPDDLVLADDPGFSPDMWILPPLDLDVSGLHNPDSQNSQYSLFSLGPRSRSVSNSVPDLDIHSSSMASGYQLPPDPFQLSSTAKGPQLRRNYVEEPLLFDDNILDFEIGEDGEVRDRDVSTIPGPHFGSDSAAAGRVRREHEEGLLGNEDIEMGEAFLHNFDDDALVLPDAEPFQSRKRSKDEFNLSEEIDVDDSLPKAKRKRLHKKKAAKKLSADMETELSRRVLTEQRTQYLENMAKERAVHAEKTEAKQAKAYADRVVWGSGIGGIGRGHGRRGIAGELAVLFSGDALRLRIFGSIPKKSKRGRTSAVGQAAVEEEERLNEEARNLRALTGGNGPQVSRFEDDEGFRQHFDDEPEAGRKAESELDHPRSSIMPWNTSASLRSHHTGSAMGLRHSSIVPGRQSRLTSASPLFGRGRTDPAIPDLEEFERLDDLGGPIDFLSSGRDRAGAYQAGLRSSSQQTGEEPDFDLFNQQARLPETQNTGASQWSADAMAHESRNFLEYVINTIDEESNDDLDMVVEDISEEVKKVNFSKLIPEESSTVLIAAQAFHHVLTLVTAGKLSVYQKKDNDDPFTEIELRIEEFAI